MKAYVRRLLLAVVFTAVFFLLFIFPVARTTNEELVSQGQVAGITSPGLPVRLTIPVINISAKIQQVGVTASGEMEVPSNIADVGWYKLGSSPGETGSAVISGHLDTNKGESGVFNNLDKLKPGDKIYVVNEQGATVTFVVRTSKTFNPGYADEVFFPSDSGKHLNLVTCDGVWDKDKKSYTKRLVVFADIM